MPNTNLVVGRARVQAARLVNERFSNSVLVMDDGFQHLPLRSRTRILLDDADPSNSRCLPAGPYREPRRNRRRADLVIPGEFRIDRSRLRLVSPDLEDVQPTRANVLTAIGDPERFVRELGREIELERVVSLPDHDPLTDGTLLSRFGKEYPVIVTAKDWVKIRERSDSQTRQILIALQDVSIEPKEKFTRWLAAQLNDR